MDSFYFKYLFSAVIIIFGGIVGGANNNFYVGLMLGFATAVVFGIWTIAQILNEILKILIKIPKNLR